MTALAQLMEVDIMSEALMEIMKPIIEPMLQQQVRQDIQGMVVVLRKLGHDDLVIKNSIKEQYSLSEEEALQYL